MLYRLMALVVYAIALLPVALFWDVLLSLPAADVAAVQPVAEPLIASVFSLALTVWLIRRGEPLIRRLNQQTEHAVKEALKLRGDAPVRMSLLSVLGMFALLLTLALALVLVVRYPLPEVVTGPAQVVLGGTVTAERPYLTDRQANPLTVRYYRTGATDTAALAGDVVLYPALLLVLCFLLLLSADAFTRKRHMILAQRLARGRDDPLGSWAETWRQWQFRKPLVLQALPLLVLILLSAEGYFRLDQPLPAPAARAETSEVQPSGPETGAKETAAQPSATTAPYADLSDADHFFLLSHAPAHDRILKIRFRQNPGAIARDAVRLAYAIADPYNASIVLAGELDWPSYSGNEQLLVWHGPGQTWYLADRFFQVLYRYDRTNRQLQPLTLKQVLQEAVTQEVLWAAPDPLLSQATDHRYLYVPETDDLFVLLYLADGSLRYWRLRDNHIQSRPPAPGTAADRYSDTQGRRLRSYNEPGPGEWRWPIFVSDKDLHNIRKGPVRLLRFDRELNTPDGALLSSWPDLMTQRQTKLTLLSYDNQVLWTLNDLNAEMFGYRPAPGEMAASPQQRHDFDYRDGHILVRSRGSLGMAWMRLEHSTGRIVWRYRLAEGAQ